MIDERFESDASELVVPASNPSGYPSSSGDTSPAPGPHEAETWPPGPDGVDVNYNFADEHATINWRVLEEARGSTEALEDTIIGERQFIEL